MYSSSSSRRPVFIVALGAAGRSEAGVRLWAERTLKPELERLEGAGEVMVAGGELREAQVRLDPNKVAARGLDPSAVAQALADQHTLAPAGAVRQVGVELPIILDGRPETLEALAAVPIPVEDGVVRLGELGSVAWGSREPDSVSRLDGERKVTLYVFAGGDASLVGLSRALRERMDRLRASGLEATVVYDRGRAIEDGINGMTQAVLQGLLIVAALLPFALGSLRRVLGVAAAVPATLALAVAACAAWGIALDRAVLAGLAVGVSSVLDSFILVAERRSPADARAVFPSMVQSFLTVCLALVPLVIGDPGIAGAAGMIRAIIAALGAALVVAIVFLPAILNPNLPDVRLSWRLPGRSGRAARRLGRRLRRASQSLVWWSASHPLPVLGLLGAATVAAFVLVVVNGIAFEADAEADLLEVHLEGPSEANLAATDHSAQRLAERIRSLPGVKTVESQARPGNADLTVRFDPEHIAAEALAAQVRDAGRELRGFFVYLPESGTRRETVLEVLVSGDDAERLRMIARATVRELSAQPWVSQAVLNFKDAPPGLVLKIDQAASARSGIAARTVAERLRLGVFGPVVVKWFDRTDMREYDVRLRLDGTAGDAPATVSGTSIRERVAGTVVGPGLRADMIGQLEDSTVGARIQHQNRQRIAPFTVHCQAASVTEAQELIWSVLRRVELPPGYAFEIDPRAKELEQAFWRLGLFAALGLVLMFCLLAGAAGSLRSGGIVMAVLPFALAIPLGMNAVSGEPLRLTSLFGAVILAGMAVNASILVVEAHGERGGRPTPAAIAQAVRSRLRPLAITVAASELGALPLLFAPSGGSFLILLALVIMLGVFAGLLAVLTLVPALLRIAGPMPIPLNEEVFP